MLHLDHFLAIVESKLGVRQHAVLQIIEEYPFSGEMQRYKRRDLRKGQHFCKQLHVSAVWLKHAKSAC